MSVLRRGPACGSFPYTCFHKEATVFRNAVIVKIAMVNGGRFLKVYAAKIDAFRDLAYKSAILKVR